MMLCECAVRRRFESRLTALPFGFVTSGFVTSTEKKNLNELVRSLECAWEPGVVPCETRAWSARSPARHFRDGLSSEAAVPLRSRLS
jgi:hypothetical protein